MPFNGLSPAPQLERAPFGLETVAEVIRHGRDDEHWAQGYQQETSHCHYRAGSWSPCTGAETHELFSQDGDAWDAVQPFFVQAEDTCADARSLRRPEARTRLLDIIDHLTWKAAERELWFGDHVQGLPDADYPNKPDSGWLLGPGSVSVGTGLTPLAGLAQVLERMAVLFPNTAGVVHMSPGTAVMLHGSLEADPHNDPKIMRVKATGTPVVIGQGYAATSGIQDRIFGTGPVTVHVGPAEITTPDLQTGAVVAQNEFKLMAEQPVSVHFDGCSHVSATLTYA